MLILDLDTLLTTALSQGNMGLAVALTPIQGADGRAYSPMPSHLKGVRALPHKCILSLFYSSKEQGPSSPKLNPVCPSGPRSPDEYCYI